MTVTIHQRHRQRIGVLALAALATLAVGCVSALTRADRDFRDGHLESACRHYLRYLTGDSANVEGHSRARYRAGLCMTLPGTELYDPVRGRKAFENVIALDPDSLWSLQARHILSIDEERDRLTAELAAQSERADLLRAEVERLTAEARQADGEVEDREERLRGLVAEIGRLKQSVAELGDLLAAREQELEQIKRIDLQTPP